MAKTYFSCEGSMPPEAFEYIRDKFADKSFFEEFFYKNDERHFSISGVYWAYSVVKQFLEDFAVCLEEQKLDDVYACRLNKGFDSEIWIISKHGITCLDMDDFIQHAIAQVQEPTFDARNMVPVEQEIVSAIVREGLKRGWDFTEGDVDSPQIKRSRDFHKIMEACDSVEEITLLMHGKNENHMVTLTFTGDEEVVTDYDGAFETYYKEWVAPIVERAEQESVSREDRNGQRAARPC